MRDAIEGSTELAELESYEVKKWSDHFTVEDGAYKVEVTVEGTA